MPKQRRSDEHASTFAALEAQFAEFEGRAANGFGMFPETGDNAMAGDQGTTVGVSSSQQPIVTAQHARAIDDRPIVRSQKAKDGNRERGKERKEKRGHHKVERRNRR